MIANMLLTALVVIAVCIVFSQSATHEDEHDLKRLLEILNKPRKLDRHRHDGGNEVTMEKGEVLGYSYKNCGTASDLASVNKLTVGPDPLLIPGNITISVDVNLKSGIQSPVSFDLQLKKKVFIWIDIPCIDDIGSCNYDDVCSMIPAGSCPPDFKKYNIPCQCPIKAGHYAVPSATITIPPVGIPSFLTDGDFQITAKAASNGKQIMCVQLELSIKAEGNK